MTFHLQSFDLRAQATDRFIIGSLLVMLFGHAGLWILILNNHGLDPRVMLNNWDSAHYTNIVTNGYNGITWAFYPLYPVLVRAAGFLTGGVLAPAVMGTLLSLLMFLLFVAGLLWIRRRGTGAEVKVLTPATRLGWLLFLFAPCSYVFHSHHTESLFLLLMLAAFYLGMSQRWLPTAVVAGLAALTRNQGVLLALACGLGALFSLGTTRERLRRFLIVGGVSAAIFSLFPLWQYVSTGDPLTFVTIQKHWRPEVSSGAYLRTFWFGNPWQNTNSGSVQRLIFFLILIGSAFPFAIATRQVAVSVFTFLHILIMPAGGDLIGAFRYGTVLFPLLFFIGDRVACAGARYRVVTWLLWPLLLYLVWFNFDMTRRFALFKWSY